MVVDNLKLSIEWLYKIGGFTGVIIVVINTKLKLVSFCTLIFAVFVKHFISRFQFSNVNLHYFKNETGSSFGHSVELRSKADVTNR